VPVTITECVPCPPATVCPSVCERPGLLRRLLHHRFCCEPACREVCPRAPISCPLSACPQAEHKAGLCVTSGACQTICPAECGLRCGSLARCLASRVRCESACADTCPSPCMPRCSLLSRLLARLCCHHVACEPACTPVCEPGKPETVPVLPKEKATQSE
jgi:hypothetical protein